MRSLSKAARETRDKRKQNFIAWEFQDSSRWRMNVSRSLKLVRVHG